MSDWLNATHDRFHTPHRAIIATGGVTAGLIGIGLEVEAIVALLAEVASFSFLVTYGLVHVSLVVFRLADPPAYDPDFAVPGLLYPIVPILGVALSVFVIAQMTRPVQIVGTGIVALGAIWYVVYARTNNVESGLLREALPGDESAYTVLVPVVNPQTQRGLLELAATTAAANADNGTAELVVLNVLRVAGDDRQNVEADRLDHQRDLLETARSTVAEMDVSLRTRALIGQDVGETILEEVKSEDADQVVVGWRGSFIGGEYAFGSNLDPVLTDAPADVTLASLGQLPVGNVTALVGDGPNTPVAVGRAAEFAAHSEGNTQPTLLTVQLTDEETGAPEPSAAARQQGREQITTVAQQAGLDPEEYTASVLAGETVESAVSETLDRQDLVCLGLSDRSDLRADRSGSIAEQIHEQASCNVAIFERDTNDS